MDDVTYRWIETERDFVSTLANHRGAPLSLDTEFAMGFRYGVKLCLLQMSFPNEIVLVDTLALDIFPLGEFFEHGSDVTTHAGHNDYEILDDVIHQRPRRGFDTQVAARLLNYSEPGLHQLTTELLGIELDKSQQRVDWRKRPLKERTLHYAASDVAHLQELRTAVSEKLAERGRLEWALEDCEAYLAWFDEDVEPEQFWWNVTNRKTIPKDRHLAAQRLAIARDKWAQIFDRPWSHVMTDAVLVEIASLPHVTGHAVFERLPERWRRREFIDDVVYAVTAADDGTLCEPPRALASRYFSETLDAAIAIVKEVAAEADVLPTVLGSRREVLDFLSHRPSKLDAGWRHVLVGEKLREMRDSLAS